MRAFLLGLFCALCSAFLCDCVGEMRLAARDRFESTFHCPRERVRVADLGAGAYRVGGCGREATYVCEAASGMAALDDPAICRQEQTIR